MMLIRFLDRMRGIRTAAPTKLEPVTQIPHAAPSTEIEIASARPM